MNSIAAPTHEPRLAASASSRRKYFYPVIISLLMTAVLQPGWPPAPARAGTAKIIISPLLVVNPRWDSNYYKSDTGEQAAMILLVQPGLDLQAETEKSSLSLHYTLDSYTYSGLDQNLDFIGHTFDLAAETRTKSENLTARLRDTFFKSRDPASLDLVNNSVSKEEFNLNSFAPEVLYRYGLSSFRLGYTNVLLDYDNVAKEDSVENRGTFEWKYELDKINAVGLNYQYWRRDYGLTTSDYRSSQLKAVYTHTGKSFTIDLGAGRQNRSFDASNLAARDSFSWNVAVDWRSPERTMVELRLDGKENDLGPGNSYYQATKLSLRADHAVSDEFTVGFAGSFQRSDYELSTRVDDTFAVEGAVGYKLTRWLAVAVVAGHESRDSNLAGAGYINNYGLLMFRFVYPVGSGRSGGA
ncbi:MAG: outer membrane beta-barrel protein [Desulfobacterales bacterium]|nr:outer membrane beta-barrel protein [Desulfobacterales bacterium]